MPSLDSLVCPKCHGPLTAHAGQELRCSRDGLRYPLIDGIPSFMGLGSDPAPLPGCALSLVLPALNEGENLDRVLPELKSALVALGPTYEIIVVDGGSSDSTREIVRKPAVPGQNIKLTLDTAIQNEAANDLGERSLASCAAVGGALDAEGAPGAEAAGGVTGGDEGEGVPTVTITVVGPAADPSQLNTNGSAGTL